ncbi:hypothetical protein TBLA_0C01590 [Henningerozyma blattae CBS 6284]|uniref:peptidylprolyl isomerase n=1 Tax=Henningerozyma blattae (strain ATCC 34711 / CBS 6284 / DSM 70876 / NBRC 10599 / NRRL Y-10934 / UCD 77-7) TaxID=1071380 RepID=I2H0S1_HENB6|nr:hypothetical protein TBLA_0C01590 [Tetrapisispora blattae CBS 6284]CCH59973.1 hypothetical protein TBLA_0C01590 [Tetrapisispora blattae CBS 6284]
MLSDPLVYLDISIDNEKIGRIVCKLYAKKAPKAAANFYSLCKGDVSIQSHKPLTYKDNYFHRVIKNFMIQCGDIEFGKDEYKKSDQIGTGGCSIYATEKEIESAADGDLACFGNFEDENLEEFPEPFMLAMANTGTPNSNSSQFFITTYPSPHLNGKHSLFGEVIDGKYVVRTIENSRVDKDGFPEKCIRIDDCGEWNSEMGVPLYNACNDKIGGDVYEENPEDDKHFESDDFSRVYEAANTIKESGTLLFKKKDFQNAFFKYKKSLRYITEYIPDMEMDKENNIKYTNLKIKLYLNMCLMMFDMQKYEEAIQYATYIIEMENVPKLDVAKAYYRSGNCYLAKKRLEDALKDYNLCKENNPNDKVVDQKIEHVENLIQQKKEKTRKNISKFFPSNLYVSLNIYLCILF